MKAWASASALERDHPMMTGVERQILHEDLDKHRAIAVEQGDTADRSFLGNAVGKGQSLGA